jgi:hypothetical protein
VPGARGALGRAVVSGARGGLDHRRGGHRRAPPPAPGARPAHITGLFGAVVEAIVGALLAAETMRGREDDVPRGLDGDALPAVL